jgi:hypothetical protein
MLALNVLAVVCSLRRAFYRFHCDIAIFNLPLVPFRAFEDIVWSVVIISL